MSGDRSQEESHEEDRLRKTGIRKTLVRNGNWTGDKDIRTGVRKTGVKKNSARKTGARKTGARMTDENPPG